MKKHFKIPAKKQGNIVIYLGIGAIAIIPIFNALTYVPWVKDKIALFFF